MNWNPGRGGGAGRSLCLYISSVVENVGTWIAAIAFILPLCRYIYDWYNKTPTTERLLQGKSEYRVYGSDIRKTDTDLYSCKRFAT
jgi:hypothetical protein